MKPQFWTIILLDVLFWNSQLHTSSGSFLLWIKSLERYTKARINELGTIAPALAAKWFAFSTIYSANAMAPALHGWVNTQLRTSPAERSFALVLITAIAQSSTAWTPLLVYKTVEAPHFIKGFSFSLGCSVALVIATHLLNQYLKRRDPQTVDPAAQVAVEEAAVSPALKSASAKETERDGLSS
ncbi:MFS transporter (Seo1) [Fusarium falciforme]|nr:MFS transporter (Seo1) [Fusarium falciforme]